MNKELREKAEEKVDAKHGFYIVTVVFASISIILYIISQNFENPAAYWIQFPILVLTLVLGIVYVSMFGISLNKPFNSTWKEEEIEREIARLSLENKSGIATKSGLAQGDENEWIESESIHYEEWNN